MAESEEQRAIRRAISGWLTAEINQIPTDDSPAETLNGRVRWLVLRALRALDERFAEVREAVWKRYHFAIDKRLLRFYMKGGNAFKVAIEGQIVSGGDSDWDTQVVIDTWAPSPILAIVHGLVEDIVLDQLRQTGIEIAKIISTAPFGFDALIQSKWKLVRHNAVENLDLSNYKLTYDDPQVLRRIFDHDRLGLWFHSNTPLRDRDDKHLTKWLPGLTFNDSIGPFILYRMGYTWHAELEDDPEPGDKKPALPVEKPILMELIDVTIPRRNTVEGVEVWDAIENGHLVINRTEVGFGPQRVVSLPFPDLTYHLREQLDMLCEIADGSSRHQDKMHKRFQRLGKLEDRRALGQETFLDLVGEQVGVADIKRYDKGGPITIPKRLWELIRTLPQDDQRRFEPGDNEDAPTVDPQELAYRAGIVMMDLVADATASRRQEFTGGILNEDVRLRLQEARRDGLFDSIQMVRGVQQLALSDDLILLDLLDRNDYLRLQDVGLSGILAATIFRVRDLTALTDVARVIEDKLVTRPLVLQGQRFNTAREGGYSYEHAFVVFDEGKATTMFTLTTASQQELEFLPLEDEQWPQRPSLRAPLLEIVRQRRMAASLIRDYIIRTALARQYEAGKMTIAGA